MFQPLLKNHFFPNSSEESDSYIPIVIVKAKGGRTPAEKSSLALAVTGAVGRGLSIPNERVWLQFEEMNPADIWFGDTLSVVMICIAMKHHLVVSPEFRGCGFGTELIDTAIKFSQKSGMKKLTLRTALWNSRAIDLYKKCGFIPRAVFSDYFGDGNDMVWMDINL